MRVALLIVPLALAVLADGEACFTFCVNTFAAHTTPDGANGTKACQQGCSLRQMVAKGASDEGAGLAKKCTDACAVAFKDGGPFRNSCDRGCTYTESMADTNIVHPSDNGDVIEVHMIDSKDSDDFLKQAMGGFGSFLRRTFGSDGPSPLLGIGPVILTQDQQAENERLDRVAHPATKTALLGVDGGTKNPFAHDFHPRRLLGDDGGTKNPFGLQFKQDNEGIDFDKDLNDFLGQFEAMHKHMTDMIRGEVLNSNVNDNLLQRLLSGSPVPGEMFIEVQSGPRRTIFEWPPSSVSDASPILRHREGLGLDLSSHEPSPPTAHGIKEEQGYHRYLSCWRRRAHQLMHAANGLLLLALVLFLVAACCLWSRVIAVRRRQVAQTEVQYYPAGVKPPPTYYESPASPMKIAVDGASMTVDSRPLVHTPPPAYHETSEGATEKDPASVNVVA